VGLQRGVAVWVAGILSDIGNPRVGEVHPGRAHRWSGADPWPDFSIDDG
jgi:hypothetical protein